MLNKTLDIDVTIHVDIFEKISEYEVKTGIKPNAIYLGEDDFNKLKEFLDGFFVKSINNFRSLEWYGTKVYEVKKKSHLSVGFVDDE